jgi:hypothetical protein
MDFWLPIAVLIIVVLGVLILFDLRSADTGDESDESGEEDDSGLESSWDAYFRERDEKRRKH